MANSKQYFHDHVVLLLLSINAFLAVAGGIFTLVRLSTSSSDNYIVQYRSNLGIDEFETGTALGILSFVVFAGLVLVVHTALSIKAYHIHRQVAIAILCLGILLLTLSIIISNALLVLR